MAYRASLTLPSEALEKANRLALQFRAYCQNRRAVFLAGGNAQQVLATYFDARAFRNEMAALAQVQGIAQYASDQVDDPAYDVVAEFQAMVTAVEALYGNIEATFPVDPSGFVLERQIVNGQWVYRTFTAPQLAPLVALLDQVIAAIE